MKVAVIDGQGGGIGRSTIEKIRENIVGNIEIIALGTNSLATANMIKGGAHRGATGENAIKVMSKQVDVIIGPIAIIVGNAMMGEITPLMAENIASSSAKKILLPMNKCNIHVVGTMGLKVNEMITSVIEELNKYKD